MKRNRVGPIVAVVVLTVLAAVAVPSGMRLVQAAQLPAACEEGAEISQQFKAGTAWRMCWSIEREGLVLSDVAYTAGGTAHHVLDRLALAEMLVSYDDGTALSADVTGYGFDHLMPVKADQCRGGQRYDAGGVRHAVCVMKRTRSVAYRTDTRTGTGEELVVFIVSEAAWYKYVSQYVFSDDGVLRPEIGATGTLAPGLSTDAETGWPVKAGEPAIATSHSHAAYWRMDFNVGGSTTAKVPQEVEVVDVPDVGAARRPMRRTAVTEEYSARADNARFWKVGDPTGVAANGETPSWEIGLDGLDHYTGPSDSQPFTKDDLYVTESRACERFVVYNFDNDCGERLDQYLDGQTLTQPVVWARVDFHHVPRTEDTPLMSTHWQGFSISPRDALGTNPLSTAVPHHSGHS